LAESGRYLSAKTKLVALGKLDQVNDARIWQLATKAHGFAADEVARTSPPKPYKSLL